MIIERKENLGCVNQRGATMRNVLQHNCTLENISSKTLWIFDHREKRESRMRQATVRNVSDCKCYTLENISSKTLWISDHREKRESWMRQSTGRNDAQRTPT